ncbi:hypothetical protein ACRDNQ_16035 [Palleronia sp. KMU-117]|uniref:hypothetical protein n=1 Tax=Palleronia sp. KMU-117 TaxID=3434108 RepID=UPI003D737FDB
MLELDEDDALFPTHKGTARGTDRIRLVLQEGSVASGAAIGFKGRVVFETADPALVQNAWMPTTASRHTARGMTVELARNQRDGRWKHVIDGPDGAALLGN